MATVHVKLSLEAVMALWLSGTPARRLPPSLWTLLKPRLSLTAGQSLSEMLTVPTIESSPQATTMEISNSLT